MSGRIFHYFAYGSNLLKERLLMNNPSATFKAVAKLEGYQLTFAVSGAWKLPGGWMGAPATIVPSADSHVWGVVWGLDLEDQASLDAQESSYNPIEVTVMTKAGEQYNCRTYVMVNISETSALPSPQYKDVMVRGARQNDLPEGYVAFLESVQDNGFSGQVNLYEKVMKKLKESDKNRSG